MTKIGVVTIGRNEGQRLRRCLESLRARCPADTPIVYVDSGSTDGSADVARALGVQVVELNTTVPFTMARGRNAGYEHLTAAHPDLTLVQFIDGDCELLENWIARGIEALQRNECAAAVSGRRRERFPEASIYNRMADMEWDTPVGAVKACHGDVMMRIEAFEKVGRFNAALIAGEEPELCVRLRRAGWKILRLDADMTMHDAAMTRFGQWWSRCVRGGWAYAQGAAMHGQPPERHKVKESRSAWLWGLIVPILLIVPAWPTHGWSLAALAAYPLLMLRVFLCRRKPDEPAAHGLLYAFFCVLAKFPQMVGQARYWLNRMRGREARLIEYKTAERPAMKMV